MGRWMFVISTIAAASRLSSTAAAARRSNDVADVIRSSAVCIAPALKRLALATDSPTAASARVTRPAIVWLAARAAVGSTVRPYRSPRPVWA